MDAGAFSDARVVEAAKAFIPILINCTTKSRERDRMLVHYRVRGFPTIIYLDPRAKELGRMTGRLPKEVAAHLEKLAAPFTPFAGVKGILSRKGDLQVWMQERLGELSSDRIEVRDKAAHELAELKRFFDAALKIASRSHDPEVRARVRHILNE